MDVQHAEHIPAGHLPVGRDASDSTGVLPPPASGNTAADVEPDGAVPVVEVCML